MTFSFKEYSLWWVLHSFSALQTLGIQNYDKEPPGADIDKVSMEKFMREAYVYNQRYLKQLKT